MATIRRRLACMVPILVALISGRVAGQAPPAPPQPIPAALVPGLNALRASLEKVAAEAEAIDDPGDRANALLEVARAQFQAGDLLSALANSKKAAEAAKAVDSDTDRWRSLLDAASTLKDVTNASDGRKSANGLIEVARGEVTAFLPPESMIVALKRVAEAAADFGDADVARETIEIMEAKARATPEGQARDAVLVNVVSARAYLGDFSGALKIAIDDIRADRGSKPEVLSGPVLTLGLQTRTLKVRGEHYSEEQRVARRDFLLAIARAIEAANFPGHRINVSLAMAFADLGEFDEASRIVRGMREGRGESPEGASRIPTFLAIIALGEFKAGFKDRARATIREALGWLEGHPELPAQLRSSSSGFIAGHQAKMGDTAGAARTLEGCSDASVRASAFHKIGTSRRLAGDLKGAREVWSGALKEADDTPKVPLSGLQQEFLLCEIAEMRAELGEYRAAIEAFEKIKGTTRRVRVARMIATNWARSGEIIDATAWTSTLADLSLRCRALIGVKEGISDLSGQVVK